MAQRNSDRAQRLRSGHASRMSLRSVRERDARARLPAGEAAHDARAYPLSLNALRLACNQSTNRDPVVDYDEATIRDALHRLERRGLVRLASGAGSRAAKYRHLLAEALPLDDAEQAVMCVLMLRGAQTPGELKQRTERMHPFAELAGVHDDARAADRARARCGCARRPGPEGGALRAAAAGRGGGRDASGAAARRPQPTVEHTAHGGAPHAGAAAERRRTRSRGRAELQRSPSASRAWSAKWPSCAPRCALHLAASPGTAP